MTGGALEPLLKCKNCPELARSNDSHVWRPGCVRPGATMTLRRSGSMDRLGHGETPHWPKRNQVRDRQFQRLNPTPILAWGPAIRVNPREPKPYCAILSLKQSAYGTELAAQIVMNEACVLSECRSQPRSKACGGLPDSKVCRTRAIPDIIDVRECLVDPPEDCPFAVAYSGGYLCVRHCQGAVPSSH